MLLLPLLLLSLSIICSCSNPFQNSQQVLASNTAVTKSIRLSIIDTFQDYFASAARHAERWHPSLDTAMTRGNRQAALYNRYAPLEDFHRAVGPADSLERVRFPSATGDIQADNLLCFTRKQDYESTTLQAAQKASNGLLTHINLDAASLLAIHILQVVPGDNVLDLCATSGETSVALAQPIWPYLYPDSAMPPLMGAKKGALHSNQLDPNGNRHLAETLAQYLPTSVISSGQQKTIHVDGTKDVRGFPLGLGGYDKVLVDPPSSSKHVAEEQVQLLTTALKAVRIGGRVAYLTRSMSREGNDGVVEKAISLIQREVKQGSLLWNAEVEHLDGVVEQQLEADWAKKTAMGWAVLPDHVSGGKWGPLYFSVLTKKST